MRKTGIVFDNKYLKHDTGGGHPERPERLNAIKSKLKDNALYDSLLKIPEKKANSDTIAKIHSSKYISRVEKEIKSGIRYLDSMDTAVCKDSYEIALYAAGAGVSAVDEIMNQNIDNAFLCVRPPGHHAENSRAMGFCVFNNIAITARYIQNKYGIGKIMILDWDVHHGNGTQNAFYSDDNVLFVSLHQYPHYPGTGSGRETGKGKGKGYTVNFPMKAGSNDDDYLKHFNEKIIPLAHDFKPGFVLISAGYDAHSRDPLGGIRLSSGVYSEFTKIMLDIADKHCGGNVVCFLEGGYDFTGLSESVYNTIKTLRSY